MNRYVNIGLACGMSAFLGAVVNLSAQAKPQTLEEQEAALKAKIDNGTANIGAVCSFGATWSFCKQFSQKPQTSRRKG